MIEDNSETARLFIQQKYSNFLILTKKVPSVDEEWVSERWDQILKKATIYDDKAVAFLEIIRNHPDYNTQMTSHAKVAATDSVAAGSFYHPGR